MREFTVDYDIDEYTDAYIAHQHATKNAANPNRIFAFFFVIGLVFFATLGPGFGDTTRAIASVIAAGIIAWLIAYLPLGYNRRWWRRHFATQMQQLALSGKQTRYEFDGELLRIEDDLAGGRVKWADLHAWHEDEWFILLYRSSQFYYYVNKAKVDSETLAALKACLLASPAKRI